MGGAVANYQVGDARLHNIRKTVTKSGHLMRQLYSASKHILKSLFNRIKIGLRIQIALLGLTGVALVGPACLVGLRSAADAERRSEASVALRFDVVQLSADYLQAGLIAHEFLRTSDQKLIAKHEAAVAAAKRRLQDIEQRLGQTDGDEAAKQSAALLAGLNLYLTRFQNLLSAKRVLGLTDQDGLQGKLRDATRRLEARLAEIDDPRLSVLMLTMRRLEKEFIQKGREKDGDELIERASDFAAALTKSDLAADDKKDIAALIGGYKSSFLAFMVSQQSLNEEIDDFASVFARNRPTLDALVASAETRYRAAQASAAEVRDLLDWIIGGVTLAMAALALLVGQRIAGSVARTTAAMQRLAAGDFEAVLPGLERSDEIGEMARAVETFKAASQQAAREEADAKIAQQRIESERRKADMHTLADGFEVAVGKVIETVFQASSSLESSAGSLTQTAETSRQLTIATASVSSNVSACVGTVAASAEHLLAAVDDIGRRILDSTTMTAAAVLQTRQTSEHVLQLARAGDRIGDIVGMIQTIARQTNLLALNATIEAARAGDAGRGFAVVAFEVKALAEQTAKATRDIQQQVSDIQQATRSSAGSIDQIVDLIERVSETITAIAAAIEQQGRETRAMSDSVTKAAAETVHVGSSIERVQRGAEHVETASRDVFAAAKSLADDSNVLRREVANFLGSVRSA